MATLARKAARLARRGLFYLKFWQPGGYRARSYWEDRHGQFGFDLRGVGNLCLDAEENQAEYEAAREVFRKAVWGAGVAVRDARMLDVGCGTGFYAQAYFDMGGEDYTGVDIADTLFPQLRKRFPAASFERHDVTEEPLEGTYDLVCMIDVEQHIVDERRFRYAMDNLKGALKPGGLIVLTSWLAPERRRRTLYEVERPRSAYKQAFPGATMSEPVPFRDKFLFTVRP